MWEKCLSVSISFRESKLECVLVRLERELKRELERDRSLTRVLSMSIFSWRVKNWRSHTLFL